MPKVQKKWSFESVELNGPGPFEVDGQEVTPEDLTKLAGRQFFSFYTLTIDRVIL